MMGKHRVGQFMDIPPPDRPLSRSERWALAVFLLIILGLFAAEVVDDFHPAKLSALFIVVFWVPLLALHEAGHALMAAAVGWRVLKVVIGFGRTVKSFAVRGVPVEIKLLPLEGFVRPAPTNLDRPRVKNALIYFAGPGAELLSVLVILLLVGPSSLLARSTNVFVIAAQSFCVAALMGVIFNLVPHSITNRLGAGSKDASTPNDGLGIVLSFFTPKEQFALMLEESSTKNQPPDKD